MNQIEALNRAEVVPPAGLSNVDMVRYGSMHVDNSISNQWISPCLLNYLVKSNSIILPSAVLSLGKLPTVAHVSE